MQHHSEELEEHYLGKGTKLKLALKKKDSAIKSTCSTKLLAASRLSKQQNNRDEKGA